MFPKSTKAATMEKPPEKITPASDKKNVAVVYIEDKHLQVGVDRNHGQNRRAAYYACAVVLTALILVAGTLGAITIVLTHYSQVTSDAQPSREPLLDDITEAPPRVEIDDGGLWPPEVFLKPLNDDDGEGRPPEFDEQASGNSSGDEDADPYQESISESFKQSSYSETGYFSDMYYDSGYRR